MPRSRYEVNFQDGITCGGAYIKLLSGDVDLPSFHEKTPYSIMFGPDKCGLTSKVRESITHVPDMMVGESAVCG